jgi:hypothetical protein
MNNLEETVSIDVSMARFQMCLRCPSLDKETRGCMECGCFMPMKVKLVDSECPLDKWQA